MSDVETVRRAAALIRERAAGAAEAWGTTLWSAGEQGWNDRQGLTYDVHSDSALVASAGCEELAEQIASWHPTAALAVAAWLDETVLIADGSGGWVPGEALDVARAYLGEDA